MRRFRRYARPLPALVVVSAIALLARLWALGWRVAHQDEARVGDWILHYMEIGAWEYYPMIHGPFLPHVNSAVFAVFGPSDFTARLVVALIGGLLPLSAYLFREHLSGAEVVALGAVLAANPLLLYYSRFMRNDVPTVAFMFVALGLFVRFLDTRRLRYLYAGTFAFAMGFTPKELALLYPFYWLGAAALLLDQRLSVARSGDEPLTSRLPPELARRVATARTRLGRVRPRLRSLAGGAEAPDGPVVRDAGLLASALFAAAMLAGASVRFLDPAYAPVAAVTLVVLVVVVAYAPYGPHLGLAAVEMFVVLVFFYAPRAQTQGGVGLFNALRNPSRFPEVVEAATWGSYQEFLRRWGASAEGHSYVGYLEAFWEHIAVGAFVLFALAVVGFLVDRYTGDGPRDVVQFCGYWGFASLLTYPIIAENSFPWEMVHVVVPLAVPAAVTVGVIYRRGTDALVRDDAVSVAAAAVLLLLVFGQMSATAYQTSFENPQSPDNPIVQYAQPAGHMQETLDEIREISRSNEGVDVLYFGEVKDDGQYVLYMDPDATWDDLHPPPRDWFGRLPLPWYFNVYGANTSATTEPIEAAGTDAPVVVTLDQGARDDPDNNARDIAERLRDRGYYEVTYQQYQSNRPLVFFVDASAANRTAPA